MSDAILTDLSRALGAENKWKHVGELLGKHNSFPVKYWNYVFVLA